MFVVIALCIDDFFLFFFPRQQGWKEKLFKFLKDQSQARQVVDIKTSYADDKICSNQRAYTPDILLRFGMVDTKVATTPLDLEVCLEKPRITLMWKVCHFRK